MIVAKQKSRRNTLYDLKVRNMVNRFLWACDTLEDFEAHFNQQILLIPRASAYCASVVYRLTKENGQIKVWHKNTNGDNDRLLFEITDTNI